jgi:hypothetical protein
MRYKYLTDKEWTRVKHYVSQRTRAELEGVHGKNLPKVINAIAMGRDGIQGTQELSAELTKEALRFCKNEEKPNADSV